MNYGYLNLSNDKEALLHIMLSGQAVRAPAFENDFGFLFKLFCGWMRLSVGKRLSLVALMHLLIWPHLATADEYRVYRSQLECVRDNVEKYLRLPGDVITIVLPACPIVDPLEAFRSLAKNNAFKREDSDQTKLDAIIRIRRTQLPCILKLTESTKGDPVTISTDGKCSK